jgi:hypothetical protein
LYNGSGIITLCTMTLGWITLSLMEYLKLDSTNSHCFAEGLAYVKFCRMSFCRVSLCFMPWCQIYLFKLDIYCFTRPSRIFQHCGILWMVKDTSKLMKTKIFAKSKVTFTILWKYNGRENIFKHLLLNWWKGFQNILVY